MKFPTYKHETEKYAQDFSLVAGCDEVGIAPLAGPVVAATVILDPTSIGKQRSKHKWWYRVRDSKTTNAKERDQLVNFIKDHCLDYAVGVVSHETIDEINIHQAALLAMEKSVENLKTIPQFMFVDGKNKIPRIHISQQPVIDGDVKILSVSAASIIAKVARDEILSQLHDQFPVYGFVKHKGYPTREHRQALRLYGVCPEHRTSFTFVRQTIRKFCSAKTFEKNLITIIT